MSTSAAQAHAEDLMNESFGIGLHEYRTTSTAPFPRAYVSDALRIVRNSGAAEKLAAWRIEDGVEPRGRKTYIPAEAALVVMLMHVRDGSGLLFSEMSHTLANRLSAADLQLIGIPVRDGTQQEWYDRLWRSVDRLLKLVDPLPGPRRKLLKDGAYRAVLEGRDPNESAKKQLRLDFLCNQLIQGSVDLMPRSYRRKYQGNVAFDATFYALHGKEGNPSTKCIDEDRRSTNYDGGWYRRGGNHNGEEGGAREKLEWGLELETATMTANKPGEKADFPLLTIAVGSHRPGKIKLAGKRMFESIQARGYPTAFVFGDTAYLPGAIDEELQGPLLKMGYTAVFDYGKDDLGQKAVYDHAIQVVGQWYVDLMPKVLVNAETLYLSAPRRTDQEKANAKALLEERRSQREIYRLKPKGVRRPDWSQQYMYPDPDTYVAYDELTGEILPPLNKRTVVIPYKQGLKYGQKFVFESAKWKTWYGLRSTVEGSYSHVKDTQTEALGNPANRRKRGNTFAYLAATLAVASANVRKLLGFIHQLGSAVPVTSKNSKSGYAQPTARNNIFGTLTDKVEFDPPELE